MEAEREEEGQTDRHIQRQTDSERERGKRETDRQTGR